MNGAPFHHLLHPLRTFLRLEAAGGILLMVTTVAALLLANSGAGEDWAALLGIHVAIGIAPLVLDESLLHWINDGLMALFFVVVGLELKRELVSGHLSSWQRASLPAFAAAGGMLVPALIYLLFNHGDATAVRGWAIPTATDIAFALGVLTLLGRRVPPPLKAFVLSIAIFDDLGAIVIIALFYAGDLALLPLGVAAALVAALVTMNLAGVRRLLPYLVLGAALWVAVLKSGVHATLAGVILAMCIPLRAAGAAAVTADSPLLRLESALHPWVTFGVLPLFALANAAVPIGGFTAADLANPVLLGIAGGLLLGKPIGILLFCWIAARLGVAMLPDRTAWSQLAGVAMLCGIGFTMSLFIDSLAFAGRTVEFGELARIGILLGTLLSAVCGYLALRFTAPDPGRLAD